MAFNKSKALENALKFLNQGKVAQAIGEYQLILRNDPKESMSLCADERSPLPRSVPS